MVCAQGYCVPVETPEFAAICALDDGSPAPAPAPAAAAAGAAEQSPSAGSSSSSSSRLARAGAQELSTAQAGRANSSSGSGQGSSAPARVQGVATSSVQVGRGEYPSTQQASSSSSSSSGRRIAQPLVSGGVPGSIPAQPVGRNSSAFTGSRDHTLAPAPAGTNGNTIPIEVILPRQGRRLLVESFLDLDLDWDVTEVSCPPFTSLSETLKQRSLRPCIPSF